MNLRRPELWILLGSLALAAWWFTRPSAPTALPERKPERRAPAIAALPPGAQLLARFDLVRIRQSGLGSAITGGGRELTGLGSLTELCGFDPTEQIQELALATPAAAGDEPALGIVATGDFEPERILSCVAKVISRRGGTPTQSKLGEFSSVRDRSRDGAEVAVRSGGPVLVGEGAYFRAMLDAADGRGPTLLGDEAHATLRDAVGGHGALSVTFVTRPGWLERWVTRDEAGAAPLGVVRAGALRVDLEPVPRATLLLACPSDSICKELGEWVEKTQRELRAGITREARLDPVSSAKVSVEPNAVRLALDFDSRKLQQLLLALLLDDEPKPTAPQ